MIKSIQLCCLLAFIPILTLAACSPSGVGGLSDGGGSSSSSVVLDMSGTWIGSWTSSTGASGSLSGSLNQVAPIVQGPLAQGIEGPEQVFGSLLFQNSSCFSSVSVDATAYVGNFTGAPSFGGDLNGSGVQIQFSTVLTLNFSGFTGSYEVLSGPCAGETGSFTGTKSSTLESPPPSVHQEVTRDAAGTTTISIVEPRR